MSRREGLDTTRQEIGSSEANQLDGRAHSRVLAHRRLRLVAMTQARVQGTDSR